MLQEGVRDRKGAPRTAHAGRMDLSAELTALFGLDLSCAQDSLNLLNDLSTLTVHLRHYTDYVGVRLQILRSQPRLRRNWIALAVAQFLAQLYPAACQTLAYYESMLRDVPEGDVEFGEVLLFHAKVLEEAGEYERCIEFLSEKSGQIVDRTAYSVQRGASRPLVPDGSSSTQWIDLRLSFCRLRTARLLLKLGRTESALWAWEVLLEENPESSEYIKATVQAQGGDCGESGAHLVFAHLSLCERMLIKPRALARRDGLGGARTRRYPPRRALDQISPLPLDQAPRAHSLPIESLVFPHPHLPVPPLGPLQGRAESVCRRQGALHG